MKNLAVLFTHLSALWVSAHLIAAEKLSSPMPELTVASNQGTPVRFAELRGQVILLNFWATWCRPCIEEMPLLEELHTQYRDADFTVLGVNIEDTTDSDKLRQVNSFVNSKNITFPILYDHQKAVFNAIQEQIIIKQMGLPTTLFIDSNGDVRYLHEGYRPGDEHYYRQIIERLIED